MCSLLSYGEVLVDFLPVDNGDNYYQPLAGGAPANVAVGFAKLGGQSYFCGGIAKDEFGKMLTKQLQNQAVNVDYLVEFDHVNTAIVLVNIDEFGERSFNFYRHNTADTKYTNQCFNQIDWSSIDIFHFCSNTLTDSSMFSSNLHALTMAKNSNTLVSFDVNLRQQLWSDSDLLVCHVERCFQSCDLVKLSREEIDYLAKYTSMTYEQYLEHILNSGVKLILISNGPDDVHVIANSFSEYVKTPIIKAVDTTAAGDSFIAGFLYRLSELSEQGKFEKALVDPVKVITAVEFASKCGAFSCLKKGAFIALPLLEQL